MGGVEGRAWMIKLGVNAVSMRNEGVLFLNTKDTNLIFSQTTFKTSTTTAASIYRR